MTAALHRLTLATCRTLGPVALCVFLLWLVQ